MKRAILAKLGLGTAQFGQAYGLSNTRGQVAAAEAGAILKLAAEAGMRVIDTAPDYGDAEILLGQAMTPSSPLQVTTRTISIAAGVDAVEAQARVSLRRLGLAKADALLVSNATDLLGPEGPALWKRMRRLQELGLFERIGVSAYAEDEPLHLARRFRPDLMQVPASLLDQRLVADGTLSELAALGVQVHLRSIFMQGLLFLTDRLPPQVAAAGPRLSRVRRMIAEAGSDPLRAALAFALDQEEASAVVVGVTSAAELRAIIAAAAAPSPGLDWARFALEHAVAVDRQQWAAA
jgi:aryl-alcohol dehydrogenase-like predicted oxidoreductase